MGKVLWLQNILCYPLIIILVEDSRNFIVSNMRVSELLVEGERRWDAEKIISLFSLREFRAILSIPLSLHACHDHVLWH